VSIFLIEYNEVLLEAVGRVGVPPEATRTMYVTLAEPPRVVIVLTLTSEYPVTAESAESAESTYPLVAASAAFDGAGPTCLDVISRYLTFELEY
jgi:hypothetical protein